MEMVNNLKGRSREPRRRGDGRDEGGIVISSELGLTLDHNLWGVQSVKPKDLNIGLLPNGPLARPKGVLPAHVVPVVHVEGEQHHRHRQLEVAPPQPRQHQVRRRRRRASLRREHLHQHWSILNSRQRLLLLLLEATVDVTASGGVLVAEAGPETRRHRCSVVAVE